MKKSYKKLFMFVAAFMFLLQTTAFGIVEEPNDYNLTIVVDPVGAATYDGEAEGTYQNGESYEVSINDFTINAGWLFDHWSDGTSGITTGGIFSDNHIEVVAYFEPSLPATTVILIEGEGYVVAYDEFNTIDIYRDDTPYVLTYLEKIGDYSYIDLEAYANEGYIFDHWEYETDMDPNDYVPYINYNYMYGDCLAGYTLTATAIFVEAPKLTIQVEAPNTGTVEIDGLYYNNIAQEASPSLSQHSNRSPQYGPPDPVSTFSAITTDEWVFYYNPNEMNSLNVTCSAIESDVAYYFDHWVIEYLNNGEWYPLQVMRPDYYSISDFGWAFDEMQTKHISATAIFVEAPMLTVQVEAPNTGTVEIEGSIGQYYDIYAPLVNQSPQYPPPAPTSTFSASTTDEWVFYYNPNEMNGLSVTCSAIDSKAYYEFDYWSLQDSYGGGFTDENRITSINFGQLEEDMVLTAYFKYNKPYIPTQRYTLTIDSTDGGSVNFEGSFTRDSGTMFDLELFEEEGYEFVKWTGDTDMLNSDGDVVLYKDTSLTAVFEEIQEEVIEEEEKPEEPEEEEILDEEIPEAPTPETGGIPFAAFGGAGAMLIGIGAILKKRNRR